MSTSVASIAAARENVYRYFLDKLAAVHGVTGFKSYYPRTIRKAETVHFWRFWLHGGGDGFLEIKPSVRPYARWRFPAVLDGVFFSEQLCDTTAGLALNVLPAGTDETGHNDNIDSVVRVAYTALPSFGREVFMTEEDGEALVFTFSLPLYVYFGNSDYLGEGT